MGLAVSEFAGLSALLDLLVEIYCYAIGVCPELFEVEYYSFRFLHLPSVLILPKLLLNFIVYRYRGITLVRKTAKQKILEYIEMSNEPVTSEQIVKGTGVRLGTVYFYCTLLISEEKIERHRGIRGLFVSKEEKA